MIQLRLFRADAPFEQLDSRTLLEGELVLGRDIGADWVIADPSCEVSRRHCVIAVKDGTPVLRDLSTNGVFIGEQRACAPREREVALNVRDTLRLGAFLIVIEPLELKPANDAASAAAALFQTVISSEALSVRDAWEEEACVARANDASPLTDAALLEAFCEGAGLDPASFMGEDPAKVMERAGAIYKQTVLGLGDLLCERQLLKTDLDMSRTKVGAEGNNPFKWASSRRVAVDLLRGRVDGFLSGAPAVRASFTDLKMHALCLMAGSRASVDAVLAALAPQIVEKNAVSGGLRLNKHEANWRAYQHAHACLADEAASDPRASLNKAFIAGYERRLAEFELSDTKA